MQLYNKIKNIDIETKKYAKDNCYHTSVLSPPTTNNYYDLLAEKCQKCQEYSVNDCLKSVEVMRKNNYHEPDSKGNCPDGYKKNTLKCPCCFAWCEPEKKSKEVSSQNATSTTDWQTYRNEEFGFEFKIDEYKNLVNIREEKPTTGEAVNKIILESSQESIAKIYIYPLSWLDDKVSKGRDENGRIIWEQDIPLVKQKGELIYKKGQKGYPLGKYLGENDKFIFVFNIVTSNSVCVGNNFYLSYICSTEPLI